MRNRSAAGHRQVGPGCGAAPLRGGRRGGGVMGATVGCAGRRPCPIGAVACCPTGAGAGTAVPGRCTGPPAGPAGERRGIALRMASGRWAASPHPAARPAALSPGRWRKGVPGHGVPPRWAGLWLRAGGASALGVVWSRSAPGLGRLCHVRRPARPGAVAGYAAGAAAPGRRTGPPAVRPGRGAGPLRDGVAGVGAMGGFAASGCPARDVGGGRVFPGTVSRRAGRGFGFVPSGTSLRRTTYLEPPARPRVPVRLSAASTGPRPSSR